MPRYPQSSIIHRLFYKGQPLVAAKGEIILGNDVTKGVYYISTGYIKVYSISQAGEEFVHIIYGPGEIFPLVWAYLGIQPESLFYQAMSSTTLWRLSRDWFNVFITGQLEFAHAMSVQLAQQFRIYIDRVDNLEYKRASERVAYQLLFLASRFGIRANAGYVIDPVVTHDVLAGSINLARESVSRELEKLERQRIIRFQDRHILIHNVQALAAKLNRPVNLERWYLA
jgi:CRP/FNR family transcriptional regulator